MLALIGGASVQAWLISLFESPCRWPRWNPAAVRNDNRYPDSVFRAGGVTHFRDFLRHSARFGEATPDAGCKRSLRSAPSPAKALLVTQVWMAIIFMTSAFLFVRSLRKLQAEPLGINTQNIVTAEFTLGQQKYSTAKQRLAFFEAVERSSQSFPDSMPPLYRFTSSQCSRRTMPFFALQGEGQPPLSH